MARQEAPRQIREYLYHQPQSVPLVRGFLAEAASQGTCSKLHQIGLLSPPQALIHPSETHILTAMNRAAGDDTGIIAPLIGVSSGKEETAEILYALAGHELERLIKAGIDLSTMKKGLSGGRCSMAVFEALNACWGNVVRGVKQVAVDRGHSMDIEVLAPAAALYRQKNVELLQKVARELNRPIPNLGQRKLIFDDEGCLRDVTEDLIIPIIPNPKPLLDILPDELITGNHQSAATMPSELFFLRKGGQAGHDVARAIASLLRAEQEMIDTGALYQTFYGEK